jgi:glucose-6-phosphate dehydrogenase assembly protein OpcA
MSATLTAQPEVILKELGRLWTSFGQDEHSKGKPSVLRACAMTLIVATDAEDTEAFDATQTVISLMQAHPSRAIFLRRSPDAENGISARVLAQCWMPFGKAQQICCEQVEIDATGEKWVEVGPTLRGIIVPDLPVVVWCRQRSLLWGERYEENVGWDTILPLATKVIADTADASAAGAHALREALDTLLLWQTDERAAGDLEWTRLTPWREAIADAFDDPQLLAQRESFHTVEIASTSATPSSAALYLYGWVAGRLAVTPSFTTVNGQTAGVARVSLRGSGPTIEIERSAPECMRVTVNGRGHSFSMQPPSLFNLMHEELTVLGRDDEFRAALVRARAQLGG